MSQLVKHQTVDFGSGHDLMVHEIKPYVGLCPNSMEPAWDSLSLFLSLSLSPTPSLTRECALLHMLFLSLSLSFSLSVSLLK